MLLTQNHIEKSINDGALDLWIISAYQKISEIPEGKDFPCLFGKHAWKLKSVLFVFLSKQNAIHDILSSLTELTHRVKTVPKEDRIYTALLCVFEYTNFHSTEKEQEFAWRTLQEIHYNDIMEWPNFIPKVPDNSQWSFSFNDVELFINISCPNYNHVKGRNPGDNIVIVINPGAHFDIVASMNDPKVLKVRQTIRERSKKYNNGLEPITLGFYGDDDNREWIQYVLHEPGTPVIQECSLRIMR
ncbi:TPA: YqcI/YcgG family protein [Klebsiella pneumoniae]|nr:YqcI/YcgG family protein [Klebsiella pneumoniae]